MDTHSVVDDCCAKVLANRLKLQAEKIIRSRHQQFAHTHTHMCPGQERRKINHSFTHPLFSPNLLLSFTHLIINDSFELIYRMAVNAGDTLQQEQANAVGDGSGRGGDSRNSSNNDAADQIASDAAIAARESKRQERKMQRKAAKSSARPEPTFRGLGCRGKSNRKRHRFENGMAPQFRSLIPPILLT